MKQTSFSMPHVSSLKHNPSYKDTEELLKEHLRKHQRCRKQSPYPLTTSDIKEEAAQILDQLLKKQLSKKKQLQPCLDTTYQRVDEEDVVISEVTSDKSSTHNQGTHHGSHRTNQTKISVHSLLQADDRIPFADEEDDEECEIPEKSRSLPSSINFCVNKNKIPARSSKSLSPSNSTKIDTGARHVAPSVDVKHPQSDLSRSSRSKSTTPAKSDIAELRVFDDQRRRHRSGSISSEDTDSPDVISPDRKKKSLFKRAKERLNRFIQRERHLKENEKKKDHEKEKTKRKKSKSKNAKKGSLVLEERQTHKFGHVEQHRFKTGDQSGIFRSQETWESTDITDRENSRRRHIDKHNKIKESTDLSNSNGGIFGTLKRLSMKKSKKGKSKSLPDIEVEKTSLKKRDSGNNSYDNSVSLFDGEKRLKLNEHTETDITESPSRSHIHTTRIITVEGEDHIEAGGNERAPNKSHVTDFKSSAAKKGEGDIDRSSHQGGIVLKDKRLSRESEGLNDISERSDDKIIRRDSAVDLPKTKSFSVDYEYDETVTKIKHKDGVVDVDADRHIHQYTYGGLSQDDIEVDGLDDIADGTHGGDSEKKDGTHGGDSEKKDGTHGGDSEKKDKSKDKLYGEIANRIAEIGDSYVHTGQQTQQSESDSGSPLASSSAQQLLGASSSSRDNQQLLGASSSSRDSEGLTSLERELRDCLRVFGDNITGKLNMSSHASDAAREIAKQATYKTFKDTINRTIGDEVGKDQLAMLFYFTNKGIQMAGAGGAVAVQIKENFLRYIEDKFAGWIVGQGGIESALTDTETSTDSELD